MASASSRTLAHGDLTDLEDPAVVGCPLEPLEGLVDRAHLPQPIPGHELLALRERPVDDRALLAVEPNAPALRAWGKAASPDYHPRFDQLFVELLVRGHRFRRRGSRRFALLAFLCQYEYTHRYLLLLQLSASLWPGLFKGFTHTSNERLPFRHGRSKRVLGASMMSPK